MRIFNVIGLILGSLLLYSGLFLREDEQGKLQNRLEEIWIRTDDFKVKAVERHTQLVREVINLLLRMISKIWGDKTFTFRAFIVTYLVLQASINFSFFVWYAFQYNINIAIELPQKVSDVIYGTPASGLTLIIYILLILAPVLIRRRRVYWFLWTLELVIKGFSIWLIKDDLKRQHIDILGSLEIEVISLTFAVLLFLVWLSIIKFSLKATVDLTHNFILHFITLYLSLTYIVYFTPGMIRRIFTYINSVVLKSNDLQEIINIFSGLLFSVTAIMLIFPITFVFIIILLLIHKLIWPVVQRPVYAIQMNKIFENQKLLIVSGIVIFLLSLGYDVMKIGDLKKLMP